MEGPTIRQAIIYIFVLIANLEMREIFDRASIIPFIHSRICVFYNKQKSYLMKNTTLLVKGRDDHKIFVVPLQSV